jgi:hypothetical protein
VYENQRNTISQRCHEHIQEVRHRIAVVAIHTVVGSVHTRVEIGRKGFAEQNRMEAGFVRRPKVEFGHRESGSDRKAQEIVEVDRRVQETVEAGRIGFVHTAAAVLEEEVEEVCCSLEIEREVGHMVFGMIEDIAEMGREGLAIGHREQEKNKRQWSAVLVPEVATGRASWQTVAVVVEEGERHSPRRQDMLDSPTWFQRGCNRDKDATGVSREVRKQRETHLRLIGLVLRLAGLFFAHQRQPTDASSSKLGGAARVQLT